MSITQNRRGNVQANDGEIDHRAYRYDELSDWRNTDILLHFTIIMANSKF